MGDKSKKPQQSKYANSYNKMTPEMNKLMDMKRFIESADKSGNRNDASKAYGYYQFLPSTLGNLNKNRIKDGLPKLTLNTREEQHEAMRNLMIEYKEFFQSKGIAKPSSSDYYGIHLLGPTGYMRVLDGAKKGKSASDVVSSRAMTDNPTILKGSAKDILTNIRSTVSNGITKAASEPKERKLSIEMEKKGYVQGRSTPLDMRPGSYKGDGQESWYANTAYYNGTKMGEQLRDYVPSKGNGSKTVIKKRQVNGSSMPDDGKTIDLYGGGYDKEEADLLGQAHLEGLMEDSSSQYANTDFSEFGDFSVGNTKGDFSLGNIKGPKGGKSNNIAPTKEQLYTGTALYDNQKNAYSDRGNIEHLNMQIGNEVVPLNDMLAVDPRVDTTNVYAENKDMPKRNTQFEKGGQLNNIDMNKKKGLNEDSNGLVKFDAGGTHEENPQGGIPQNTNPDGTINKVEEGETKHQDYVFSNELKINSELASELNLPEDVEGMTFADASKYLNRELEENEQDPIVKRTVEKQLTALKQGNEVIRKDYEEAERMELEQAQAQELEAQQPVENEQQVPAQPPASAPEFSEGDLDMNMEAMMQQQQVPQGQEADQASLNEARQNMFDSGGNLLDDDITEEESMNGMSSTAAATGSYGQAASGVFQGSVGMFDAFNQKDAIKRGERINANDVALKGMASGATIGASVGSVIPGLGTAIGGAVGGVVGGVSGLFVGKSAAKKAEKQRGVIHEYDNQGFSSDFRSGSGQIEDDTTRTYAEGGPLKNFNKSRLEFDPNYLRNSLSYGSDFANTLSQGVYGETLPEMVIETERPIVNSTKAINPTNQSLVNMPVSNPVGNYSTPANSFSPASKSEESQPNGFQPKGGNALKYAGIVGAYSNMKKANAKTPVQEAYTTVGDRMEVNHIDENSIMASLREQAYSNRVAQQNMAGGNASAARANILASEVNSGQVMGEALMKAREYNNELDLKALDYNNRLDQNNTIIRNKQAENNYANRSALEDERFLREQEFYGSLAELGRQKDMENKAYNLSGGYDQYGRKNRKSLIDELSNSLFSKQ